jgi:hypothetical protein
MVKNKTTFFMLFCLSDANIIHFHNKKQLRTSKPKDIQQILIQFYEIHNFKKKDNMYYIQFLTLWNS